MDKVRANLVVSVCMAEGLPLQLSKLVACQSCFESANWSSKLFIQDNNGFGYKFYPKSKHQLKTPGITSTENDPYAAYATFADSIKEICDWVKRRQRKSQFPADLTMIQMPEQYSFLLKSCGYYGGKQIDYAHGIASNLEKLNSDIA